MGFGIIHQWGFHGTDILPFEIKPRKFIQVGEVGGVFKLCGKFFILNPILFYSIDVGDKKKKVVVLRIILKNF